MRVPMCLCVDLNVWLFSLTKTIFTCIEICTINMPLSGLTHLQYTQSMYRTHVSVQLLLYICPVRAYVCLRMYLCVNLQKFKKTIFFVLKYAVLICLLVVSHTYNIHRACTGHMCVCTTVIIMHDMYLKLKFEGVGYENI